jgi:hypothetical protein
VSEEDGITGAKGLEHINDDENLNADLNLKGEQKAEAALALILYGASWSKAARITGYSSAFRCRAAVERVLATSANSSLDRDRMRNITEKRLNKLLQSVMPKAIDPGTEDKPNPDHLAYNARALALVDRIARLYGVDAPQQFQITATDERISEYVGRVRQLAGADMEAEEADIANADPDIIEGELVGDTDAESTG